MKSILAKLEKTLRKKRMFKKRETIKQVEEGNDLAPKFDNCLLYTSPSPRDPE